MKGGFRDFQAFLSVAYFAVSLLYIGRTVQILGCKYNWKMFTSEQL